MPGIVHCDDQGVEFRLAQTVRFSFSDLVDFSQSVELNQALLFFNEKKITDLVFAGVLNHQALLRSIGRVLTAYVKVIINDIRVHESAWIGTGLDLTVCLFKLQCVKDLLMQLNTFKSLNNSECLDSKLGLNSWVESLKRVQVRLNRLWGQRSSLSSWVRHAGLIWNQGSDYLTFQSSVREQGRLDRIVFDLLDFFDLANLNGFIEGQAGVLHCFSLYGFNCIELHSHGKRKPIVLWDSSGRLTRYYSIPLLSMQRVGVIEELSTNDEQQPQGARQSNQTVASWCHAYRLCYRSAFNAMSEGQVVGGLLQTLLELHTSLQSCPGGLITPSICARTPFLPFYISKHYGVSCFDWQERHNLMEFDEGQNPWKGLNFNSI